MSPRHTHQAVPSPSEPDCELAEVVRRYADAYRARQRLSRRRLRVLRAIELCRTAALGGHRETCAQCGFERYAYNSCRNRHCPKCQTLTKMQWLADRQAELLPVPYFHNVFTLPHELNRLILVGQQNQRALLNLLFRAAADTLIEFARNNLRGRPGVTMVLHTWDQQLRPHFHVHCVIAGGVLTDDGHWKSSHPKYLFPVRALSAVFRAKFLDRLKQLYADRQLEFPTAVADLADPQAFQKLLDQLWKKPWVVYSKRPFGGPQQVLDYLGRYTHRVAISNHRLVSCDDGQVVFRYRDRRDGDSIKTMSLPADQFLSRFLSHVLPDGFMRIRHYGFLASAVKKELLACCRQQLKAEHPPRERKTIAEWMLELTGRDITRCPECGGPLMLYELPPALAPPLATLTQTPSIHSSPPARAPPPTHQRAPP